MTLWLLARSAGFVALLAASLTVALGAAGTGSRRDGRILAQLVHRSAAVVTLAMLALHAALLVADHYVSVSVSGALLPFTAGYRGFALGLGTLGAYAFLVVAATGSLRGRLASSARAARAWRGVHLAAYAAWALALGHGVLAGTDTARGWALAVYGACAALVGAGVLARTVGGRRQHHAALPTARRAAALSGAGVHP
jgi:methionine sulfoxide reductase heme-binding subunit